MERRSPIHELRDFVRRRERTLLVVYLAGLAVLGGLFSVGEIRTAFFDRLEGMVRVWDNRWTRRVEHGERLVESGRYAEAVAYLAALDRDFPASHVKYKRDKERERVLRGLAHSYVEMGRKRLALDTYQRLVEFDPRNFENHYLFAMACLRLREPALAKDNLARVLTIYPTHLPSLQTSVSLYFEKGDFGPVIEAYETYLNAFLLRDVTLALGDIYVTIQVPVDGQFHDIEAQLARPPGWSGELAIQTAGYSMEVAQVTLEAPIVVGKAGLTTVRVWPGQAQWRVEEMTPVAAGLFRALGSGAAWRLDVQGQPQGIAKTRLRLRMFKPLDSELWQMVERSYRNLVAHDRLAAARARSIEATFTGAPM